MGDLCHVYQNKESQDWSQKTRVAEIQCVSFINAVLICPFIMTSKQFSLPPNFRLLHFLPCLTLFSIV